jgi:hypothetical protein
MKTAIIASVLSMLICSILAAADNSPEYNLQKTGGSGGNISSLKIDVIKKSTGEREKPCSSVWTLLVEDASGTRSLVIGFVPYKSTGMRGHRLYGQSEEQIHEEIIKAMQQDTDINGAELKHFTVSPWPAMASGGHGVSSITQYDGGWSCYILSGKPTKKQWLIIAWRMELWQDGKMVAQYSEPSQQFMKIKSIPDEWWVPNKYPGKISGPQKR